MKRDNFQHEVVSEAWRDRWKVYPGWRPPITKSLTLEVESVSKQRQTDIGRMGGSGDKVGLQIPLRPQPSTTPDIGFSRLDLQDRASVVDGIYKRAQHSRHRRLNFGFQRPQNML